MVFPCIEKPWSGLYINYGIDATVHPATHLRPTLNSAIYKGADPREVIGRKEEKSAVICCKVTVNVLLLSPADLMTLRLDISSLCSLQLLVL